MAANETTRKIYFYRAVVTDRDGNEAPFDPVKLMKLIDELPASIDGKALPISDKTRLTAKVYSIKPPKLLFGKAQLRDYPYEETKKLEWKDLPIAEGGGVADLTHVAFYPNGIVGQVFNYRGPHISRLSTFLELRCSELIPNRIEFKPLMRSDALGRILGMERIRTVKFTIDGGAADRLANAKASRPLLLAAKEVAEIGQPFTIAVTISAIRNQESVREVVADLAKNRGLRQAVRQVHVEGSEYYESEENKRRRARRESVDLLSRSFVFEEAFVTYADNKYTIDDEVAFKRMDSIYTARADELNHAASIS